MHIIYHLIINFIIGIVLLYFFPNKFTWIAVMIIVLSGVLIDLDHVVYYTINGGDSHLDFVNNNPHFYFFHTIEFIILIIVLSFFSRNVFFIMIGSLSHLLADIMRYIVENNYAWLKYWSVIYYFLIK